MSPQQQQHPNPGISVRLRNAIILDGTSTWETIPKLVVVVGRLRQDFDSRTPLEDVNQSNCRLEQGLNHRHPLQESKAIRHDGHKTIAS